MCSLGEQQRVAFARLLLHRPGLSFLDEATSAVDSDTEAVLYKTLQHQSKSFVSVGEGSGWAHERANLAMLYIKFCSTWMCTDLRMLYILAGHRKELCAYHTHVLEHRGGWQWRLQTMQEYLRQRQ